MFVRELMISLRLATSTIVLCCVLYPLAILVVAAAMAPEQRMGSLLLNARQAPIGSRLIAQEFRREEYLWPRPSAVQYNAAAAAGSNLSPTNPVLRERAESIIQSLHLPAATLAPADLVTASGSGLDPHISLAGAYAQIPRIAQARKVDAEQVRLIIEGQARAATGLGAGSDRIVNVLETNLSLDRVCPLSPGGP